MQTVVLDASEITAPQALHAAFAAQLALPEYYGRNLDALFDVLTAMSEPVTLVLRERAALEANLGDYFHRLLRMLAEVNRQAQEELVTLSMTPEELLPPTDE